MRQSREDTSFQRPDSEKTEKWQRMRKLSFPSYGHVLSEVAKSLCPRNFEAGLEMAKKSIRFSVKPTTQNGRRKRFGGCPRVAFSRAVGLATQIMHSGRP